MTSNARPRVGITDDFATETTPEAGIPAAKSRTRTRSSESGFSSSIVS